MILCYLGTKYIRLVCIQQKAKDQDFSCSAVEVCMNNNKSRPKIHERAKYRIQVCGIVSENWEDYFSGMTIRVNDQPDQEPETILTGWLEDQAALLGVLNLLHEWGHALIFVEYLSG
jgi:hypothetical protein